MIMVRSFGAGASRVDGAEGVRRPAAGRIAGAV